MKLSAIGNFTEGSILNMPLDKFHRYVDACTRKELEDRKSYTIDTMAAIASAFSKDGLQKYLKTLDESYK